MCFVGNAAEGPPPYDDVSAAASPSASSSDIGQRPPQPRILTAETVEVFSRDFRDDHIMELEKAASGDTFHFNRFGNKNAYMFMAIRVMIDVGICGPSPSCSTSRSSSLCRTDGRGRRRSSGESRRAETCPGTSDSTATNHSCNVMWYIFPTTDYILSTILLLSSCSRLYLLL